MTEIAKDLVNYVMFAEAPSPLQNRFEYNTDGTVLYAGYAVRGATAAMDVWTIMKFTYTSLQVTLKQTCFRTAWNDRASGDYQ